MKLNIHQTTAMWWLISSPAVFEPVMKNANRPDVGAFMAWGVCIVAVMILFVPLLMGCAGMRRWFGWADALSERQRQALAKRDLRRYYKTAFDDGYVSRVCPYLWRITWVVVGGTAVTSALPASTGHPALDALIVFSTWYPAAVMLAGIASLPLGGMLKQRRKKLP